MFHTPRVTRNLLIVNTLAFLACVLYGHDPNGNLILNNVFGLHFFKAADFHIYQLITYMFMHANLEHIFFNMFALWMFGCVVENIWGPKKFLFYYLACGVGAGLCQELAQYISISVQLHSMGYTFSMVSPSAFNGMTTVGASGAIYAVLLAFGMLLPNEKIFIFPFPIPIKAKWFVLGYVAIELFSALATPGDQVAHFAHLGGMLFGFLMIRYWNKHPGQRYGMSSGEAAFNRVKNVFGGRNRSADSGGEGFSANGGSFGRNNRHSGKSKGPFGWKKHKGPESPVPSEESQDWNYNARKKAHQEEIDRILDKIRKSGYDSLTAKEKQELFDESDHK
ncbi:MAG: rhomboid family intramembrane serine protease [Prevotella sp.]|nr:MULTISPECIES: rhomboid family intramembrane serine protease [unclassified Prevotella]MCH3970662.1 rhomboid family intramembrane serine protease [Prevotella sp.]MCH3984963.1 rhomboid family intramembrane serine protease [Prevotella sp.]MCH3991535.1 rhomboid family intramembrane serine protease [Prevotella sp.]MCH4018709.1 rhomboid family intramembrane serine protease [Prevotella sp.]MCH4100138.1 rhomboid family intramembrane serine protease [Prevotella sp.]